MAHIMYLKTSLGQNREAALHINNTHISFFPLPIHILDIAPSAEFTHEFIACLDGLIQVTESHPRSLPRS